MPKKALVVVLGDLARSPRMQYHCMSLAKRNYDVTVIANGGGSAGDKACAALESNQNINQHLIRDRIDFKKFLPSALAYILKPLWQALLLAIRLILIPTPNVIIVQNPPSIPTLPIIYLYTRIVRSRLIIDWHNYGFTILSLNLKRTSPFVRIMEFLEIYFGQLADAGFCVSKAMRSDLIDRFKITYPIYVLYDKPPSHFKPLSVRKKHEFYYKIQSEIQIFKSKTNDWYDRDVIPQQHQETRFTITDRIPPYNVIPRPDRPAIILSSTSWTEDEDFALLLTALKHYDETVSNQYNLDYAETTSDIVENWLPELVCVITGKGPLKAFYEEKIKECNFEHINIVLPWLSAEDYAKMVASCDLGISLHSSSSGVDLPMKIVDLFGCGVPVLAYKYPAINELVVEDFYGLTFQDSMDLFIKLTELLRHFRHGDGPNDVQCDIAPIERYKKNIVRHFLKSRWEINWDQVAGPLFDKLSNETIVKTSNESKKLNRKKL